MSPLIKVLWEHLMKRRESEYADWETNYRSLRSNVKTIKSRLEAGQGFYASKTYEDTPFEKEESPWKAFAKKLIFEHENGISSTGLSTLKTADFDKLLENGKFVDALEGLIQSPTGEKYKFFRATWEDTLPRKHRLRVNRVTAACTDEVSSTVSEDHFDLVYKWLDEKKLLRQNDKRQDWFERNQQVMGWLEVEFHEEDAERRSIFVRRLYEHLLHPLDLKKQLVRYGAPGTGKTYTARRDAEQAFSIWKASLGFEYPHGFERHFKVVQFHPSFGYEDFIEGLRPLPGRDGRAELRLQNGVFKDFCRRAAAWEKDVFALGESGSELAEKWEDLRVRELKAHEDVLPKERWTTILKNAAPERLVTDLVPPFFFLVDEINRAELSRVLGELMLALEYRGIGGAVSTQYSRLNTEDTAVVQIGDDFQFFVPHNLYFIGTMNTIDRSVESFDLALRRRFDWERVHPDIEALRYDLKRRDSDAGRSAPKWIELADDLDRLNKKIQGTPFLGRDYEIGHAYLMNLKYPRSLKCSEVRKKIWNNSIGPLLEEYLRGSGRAEELIPEFEKAFGL